MRFAAIGRTQWLYDAIGQAREAGHELALLGTCPASPESTRTETDFADLARELDAPFFSDARINEPERVKMAAECGAPIAISVNWQTLIREPFRSRFELGVINAHAGDLPRYRGNAPVNWAILRGEPEVVLSLHRMVDDLDAGPVVGRRVFPLSTSTYVQEVIRFLDEQIPRMFVEALDRAASGALEETPQSIVPTDISRCLPRHPFDSQIRWEQTAVEICALVRATAEPFAGAYTYLGSDRLTVWRAHVEPLPYEHIGVPGQVLSRRPDGGVAVLTGDGTLVITESSLGSETRRTPSEIVRSTRARLGMTAEIDDVYRRLDELIRRVEALEDRTEEP